MKTIYLDCFSGISGDMFLAAMLDAGLPVDHLNTELNKLNLPEFHGMSTQKVMKGALSCTQIEFALDDLSAGAEDTHDHDHDDGHDHPHEHEHPHSHEHPHDHDQGHSHSHDRPHRHHGLQRNLPEIIRLIDASALSDGVKSTSGEIFQILAQAEARVHGTTVEEVHFHEVGASDSILDIVGAAAALEFFGIEAVHSSPVPLGSGQVMTQHGLLPIPAPATLELLRMAHAPITPSAAKVELVTPTGAAILAARAIFKQPELILERTGIGAGKRELEWPNVLRVMMGETNRDLDTHVEIETNIDDMSPQVFGYMLDKLLAAGALDVFYTPIQMKKNRPATRLSVIARQEDEARLAELIIRGTSTFGVRAKPVHRYEADRRMRTVETRFGPIPVKEKILDGQVVDAAPEYDVCVKIAEDQGVDLREVMRAALE